jgi:hypothetical protein
MEGVVMKTETRQIKAQYEKVLKNFKIPFRVSYIDEDRFERLTDGTYRKIQGAKGWRIQANGEEVVLKDEPIQALPYKFTIDVPSSDPVCEYLTLHMTKYRGRPFVHNGVQVIVTDYLEFAGYSHFTLSQVLNFEIEGLL